MKLLQLAGAAALCGALLLTACAKKTDESASTSSTTDTSQSAATTPAADAAATTAPAADASATTAVTSMSSSSGNGAPGDYIDLPVYPGASEAKDQGMAVSSNGTSLAMKVYTTKDDTKRVADWYKSHLPSSWKDGIITAGGKTVGTFSSEHADGDQSVIIANQDDTTTRIQLTTKHGK